MKKVSYSKIIQMKTDSDFPCVSLYCNSQDEIYDVFLEAQKILLQEKKDKISKKYLNAIFRLVKVKKLRSSDFPIAFFLNGETHLWTTLPFKSTKTSVVATSFHIKPLLKWTQRDMAFTTLHIADQSVFLYEGSVATFALINQMEINSSLDSIRKFKLINQFLRQNLISSKTPLIVAGQNHSIQSFLDQSTYSNILSQTIHEPDASLKIFHKQCLNILMPFLKIKEKNTIQKFYEAKAMGQTVSNLNDIAVQVIHRKVKHLLVNENLHLWGELNKENGSFSYSYNQLNAKDDDILDDLCQIVLNYGGQVTVLPQESMPGQKAACAIIEKIQTTYKQKYLQEVQYDAAI